MPGRSTRGRGGPHLRGPASQSFIQETHVNGGTWDALVWQDESVEPEAWSDYVICEDADGIQAFQGFGFLAVGAQSGARSCEGLAVTAGGVDFAGTVPPPGSAYVHSSVPYDDGSDETSEPDDGWDVSIHGLAAPPGAEPFAAATCREVVSAVPSYRTATEPVAPVSKGTVDVACENDEHVMGGGSSILAPSGEAHLVDSYPVDRGDRKKVPDDAWRTTVANMDDDKTTVTGYAICF